MMQACTRTFKSHLNLALLNNNYALIIHTDRQAQVDVCLPFSLSLEGI